MAFDAGAFSGVRAILHHPRKIPFVFFECFCIFGYPFGWIRDSNFQNYFAIFFIANLLFLKSFNLKAYGDRNLRETS